MEQVITIALLAVLLAGAFGPTALAADGAPRPPAPADAIHEWVLQKALSDTHDLRVFLRAEAGRFVAGVATGLLGPVDVDCTALKLDGDSITGSLKVSIGYDGYFPADGKPVLCEYRVEVKAEGGALRGTFEGTVSPARQVRGAVTGSLSGPVDLSGYWVMELQMENAAGTGTLGAKSYGNRVYPKLFLKDGKPVQALIYGWGRRAQINYFESVIAANDLAFDGKRLSGALTVQPTGAAPGTDGGSRFVFTFDGTVVGANINGTFKKHLGGKEHPGGPFHGTLQAMPARPLNQSLYYLELHRAVLRTWVVGEAQGGALQLMTFAPCSQGKFGPGMAYAAAWNHTYHDVDASGLTLNGTALTGELKVTLNPDPYMPPDRKPVPASYTIAATVTDGRIISGSYTGTIKDQKVSGPVFGELLDQPPAPEPVSVNVKLEEGVNGGAPWFRRTYINFVATKGRAESGSMSNNKNGWKGTFKQAEVTFAGAAFTATIEGTVDESNGPEKGAYTFKLTGKVIGEQLVGTVETYREGKLTKSGTAFMGGFGPARR